MSWRFARYPHLAAGAAAFAVSGALAAELTRPFRAGPVAFDSAVAVLYFERIASGRQLESVLTTTPKPLLTLIYGPLYALSSDWRVISWAAIIAFALGVALATVLAFRIAGGLAAGFMAVGLAAAPQLLLDVGLALGWPWALLALALAGLALARPRPRYGLAGLALAVGVLARLELAIVVIGMVGTLGVATILAWRSGRPVPWPPMRLLVAVVALPIMLLHDWLLTGNPLHWAGIADRYTRGQAAIATVPGVQEIWDEITGRFGGVELFLCVLAAIGIVWLYRTGHSWLAIGLVLLGPGVAVFLLLLGARGTFVDDRYYAAIDVAVVGAAAFAAGPARRYWPRRLWARLDRIPPVARHAAALTAGALAAGVLTAAWGAFAPGLRDPIRNQLHLAIDTRAVLPTLQAVVDAHPSSRSFVESSLDGSPLLFVPVRIRPHLVVDLGTPLPEIGSTPGRLIDLAAGYPGPGQVVYHHLRGERYLGGFDVLKTTVPVERGGVLIVPLIVDEGRGYWVVAIEAR